jgi:hypothetical protein
MPSLLSGHANVGAILGAIQSSVKPVVVDLTATRATAKPFVTISREAGAGGRSVGDALAKLLAQRDPGAGWKMYDRELVEKVASDHQIEASLVEAIENQSHSWVKDLFAGLAGPATPGDKDDAAVVQRVSATIRALAEVGHSILIGRGGGFITAGMPGGVRVRLIAPVEHRVKHFAQLHSLTERRAAEEVARLDENRRAFFERFWPDYSNDPLAFTLTVNTANLTDQQVAQAILPLVPR